MKGHSLARRVRKIARLPFVRGGLRALLEYRVLASGEHLDILSKLDCETVVDIGANRGQFLLAARHSFPGARIFAFEPLAAPRQIAERLAESDPLTRIFPVAVGESLTAAVMHVSRRDDSSSLLEITDAQASEFPGTEERAREAVTVGPLTKYLGREEIRTPALVKIDVQGYELAALRGCGELLTYFEWVYVECSFRELYRGQAMADEVICWLRSRGYNLRGIYNLCSGRDGEPLQGDFLFARRANPISQPDGAGGVKRTTHGAGNGWR